MKSTLVIAAAIFAAVRLARDPEIGQPLPCLIEVISDSVNLARMILDITESFSHLCVTMA
jgi:hypothetical protein